MQVCCEIRYMPKSNSDNKLLENRILQHYTMNTDCYINSTLVSVAVDLNNTLALIYESSYNEHISVHQNHYSNIRKFNYYEYQRAVSFAKAGGLEVNSLVPTIRLCNEAPNVLALREVAAQ